MYDYDILKYYILVTIINKDLLFLHDMALKYNEMLNNDDHTYKPD